MDIFSSNTASPPHIVDVCTPLVCRGADTVKPATAFRRWIGLLHLDNSLRPQNRLDGGTLLESGPAHVTN